MLEISEERKGPMPVSLALSESLQELRQLSVNFYSESKQLQKKKRRRRKKHIHTYRGASGGGGWGRRGGGVEGSNSRQNKLTIGL